MKGRSKKLQKKSLNRDAATAGFYYIMTQMLVRGITFFVTPIYTRLMSAAQYGQIRVYESWLLIFVPLMSLGLYRGVERAKYDFHDDYDGYVASSLALSYISILVWMLGFLCFYQLVTEFLNMDWLLFVYMFLYIFGYTAMVFYQRREKQKIEYKNVAFITAATMFPATIFSILLLYWGNHNGYTDDLVKLRVIGYYTPQIVVGIILAVAVLKRSRQLFRKDYWSYGIRYSLPLVPELLSIQIMSQSDKIMIQKMSGYGCAGIFALATSVSYIVWIIEESVWHAWLPWLYEKIERGEERDIEKPWLVVIGIFGIFTWIIVMVSPEIVLFWGGKDFAAAAYLVPPMLLGTLFRFFSYIYSAMQNYYKKTKYVAYGTVTVMVLNVFLNYVCIMQWGYQAAAYTTAFCYFTLMVLQGVLEKIVTGMCMIPIHKMFFVSVIIFASVMVSMRIYGVSWLIRWSMAGAVGLFFGIKLIAVFVRIREKD